MTIRNEVIAAAKASAGGPWWMIPLREFGAAGAVLALAIYVIVHLGHVINANTLALTELTILVREMRTEIKSMPNHGGGRRD